MIPESFPSPLAQPRTGEETDIEFQGMVETLVEVLRQQVHHTERLRVILRHRVESRARGDRQDYEDSLEVGREAVTQVILVERERVAATTELGLFLGHRNPSRLRIAELVLYLRPEDRDELLELRELLRDNADDIDQLHSVGGLLERRVHKRVTLFTVAGTADGSGDFKVGEDSSATHETGVPLSAPDDVDHVQEIDDAFAETPVSRPRRRHARREDEPER